MPNRKSERRGGSGFAVDNFAVADGEGDFGEGGDALGGVGGEEDEVGVVILGDAAGVGLCAETLGGIGGEGGQDLGEG